MKPSERVCALVNGSITIASEVLLQQELAGHRPVSESLLVVTDRGVSLHSIKELEQLAIPPDARVRLSKPYGNDMRVFVAGADPFAGFLERDFGLRLGCSPPLDHDSGPEWEQFVRSVAREIDVFRGYAVADMRERGVLLEDLQYWVRLKSHADAALSMTEAESRMKVDDDLVALDIMCYRRGSLDPDFFPPSAKAFTEALSAPNEPGCFRLTLQAFGMIATHDIPILGT